VLRAGAAKISAAVADIRAAWRRVRVKMRRCLVGD